MDKDKIQFVCVCVCGVSVVKRSVSACKTDRQPLTERQSKAAERCSFVLHWLAEVNGISSVRPPSQWHALVTLTGWHHRWHHRPRFRIPEDGHNRWLPSARSTAGHLWTVLTPCSVPNGEGGRVWCNKRQHRGFHREQQKQERKIKNQCNWYESSHD